jgi:hypothetical protein
VSVPTILPSAYANTIGQIILNGDDPYLDTSDSDTSYVQIAASLWNGSRSSVAFLSLPATNVCDKPSKVEMIVEGKWVNTGGSLPPEDGRAYCLGWLSKGTSTLSSNRLTEYVEPGHHRSTDYTTEALVMEDRFGEGTGVDWPDVAAFIQSGGCYLVLQAPSWADDYYDFRVTYAALKWTCDVRLRQRQRDDLRQRQADSRQLTARQRGYF